MFVQKLYLNMYRALISPLVNSRCPCPDPGGCGTLSQNMLHLLYCPLSQKHAAKVTPALPQTTPKVARF